MPLDEGPLARQFARHVIHEGAHPCRRLQVRMGEEPQVRFHFRLGRCEAHEPGHGIADEAWQGSFNKFTNIIDVYVNYLRKKIDNGKDERLIHTMRSVGYILKEEG